MIFTVGGAPVIQIADIYNPLVTCGGLDIGLGFLEQQLQSLPIDLDPPYQRGHRWTEMQQAAFVGHMLAGGRVDPLIVNKIHGGLGEDDRFEMVDGKQRLTALLRWVRNEIPCVVPGRAPFYRHDTDGRFRMGLSIRVDFVRLSELECMEFYVRLNRGGTPHTDEEIARVERMIAEHKATQTPSA